MIKSDVESLRPGATGPSQIESSNNFTTMWYQALQSDTARLILTSVIIVILNVFEGEKSKNVHRLDKKMRGHSNVTMCEWLINSFFASVIGWFAFSGPWRWKEIKKDGSIYPRRNATLLTELILRINHLRISFKTYFIILYLFYIIQKTSKNCHCIHS